MSISRKVLDHPILTLIVFTLLGILGIFSMKNMAISLMPDIDNPIIYISTIYTNAGPESVEKSVTKILEDALVGVNKLKEINSTSSEGSSSIRMEFQYGTDLEVATSNIRDKIDNVIKALPDDVARPSIWKMDSDAFPILQLAISGNRSNDELRQIATYDIADILVQADGVAEASVNGGRDKIVRVELEQNRLAAFGLSVSAVRQALIKQNLELGGGKINEGKRDYIIRTTGEFSSIEQINSTVIATINGYDVKLSDIGRAFMGYKDKTQEVYINGVPGVYIGITKQSGENSVNVANAVYKKIEQIQSTLPNDVKISIIRDDTDDIRETIDTLIESAVQGLILAVLILFIFLQNVKSTLIIAISIPLSIIITLFAMFFAHITLNLMTLTGLILGIGMIVDASIVMIENIYTYRTRGAKPDIAAVLGSQEMVTSVISGNLTTVCVFIPLLLYIRELGFLGQMFKGIIFTVVIALISSLLVAVFLVPALAGKFLKLNTPKERPVKFIPLKKFYDFINTGFEKIRNAYDRSLRFVLQNRLKFSILFVLLLIMAGALIPTMQIVMMPNGKETQVQLNVNLPIGTPLSETTIVMKRLEQIVTDEIKGYKTLITSIGTGRVGYSYKGNIKITLPPTAEQIDSAETVQEKLRAHFSDFAGVKFTFRQNQSKQMTGSDLKIVIRSADLDGAMKISEKVRDVMESINDIGEVSIDTEEGLPEVEVIIDRPKAYALGVDVTTAANEIYYAMDGVKASTYRADGREYDIKLMYQAQDKEKVSDLESLYVKGTNGLVSISNFATVKKGLSPVSIRRQNQQRTIKVTADIVSTQNANVVEDLIKEKISETFIVPDNIHISYEGSWKDIQDQRKVYALIITLAVILVFGVMAGTYESFKAPLINLGTMPFMIIGVVICYKLFNEPISMMSMIGLIMLVGIVVNNGIILVDYTNLLVDRGYKKMDACIEAGTSRLRPVMMTTLTTVLGMLPMCFATEGSAGMVRPIAIAVMGGLTSSTFITLYFIPILYSVIMGEKKSTKVKVEFIKEEKSNEKK